MTQNFFYIKVKVETNRELSDEQLEELAENMEVTVKSNTEGIKIEDSSIEENAKDFEMKKTF